VLVIPYINLSNNWRSVENPNGPWTLKKKSGKDNNALQISSMQRKSGKKLVPEPDLQQVAVKWAIKTGGVVTESDSGECVFGRFGRATFTASEFQFCQCWTISNGVHFINVTHLCDAMPDADELREVAAMALSAKLIDGPPKKSRVDMAYSFLAAWLGKKRA